MEEQKLCIACGQPARISILLASGPQGDSTDKTERWYIPNQIVRQAEHEHGGLIHEIWFCGPCMRKVEDNFRASILYLQTENGLAVPESPRGEDDNVSSMERQAETVQTPGHSNRSPHSLVSYGNRPSLASLVDWARNQFVLLKTRTGGLVHIGIAKEVLDDVAEWETKINIGREDSEPHQYLKLRAVWMDDAHGAVVLFIQLLHDSTQEPALTADEILEIFHEGSADYSGQAVHVEVSIKAVNTYSDYFWPVADEFYDWVEEIEPFDTGIVEALLSRLGKETFPLFYDQVARESSSLAAKLPKEIGSRTDLDRVKQVLEEESDNLTPKQSKAITLDYVETAYTNLNSNRDERLRQAKASFNTALVLAGIGVLIIFLGIILLFVGRISEGTITSAAGVIPELISLLLFRFNQEKNDRLDKVTEHLNLLDKTRVAIHVVELIKDTSKRNKVIADLVKDLHAENPNS